MVACICLHVVCWLNFSQCRHPTLMGQLSCLDHASKFYKVSLKKEAIVYMKQNVQDSRTEWALCLSLSIF